MNDVGQVSNFGAEPLASRALLRDADSQCDDGRVSRNNTVTSIFPSENEINKRDEEVGESPLRQRSSRKSKRERKQEEDPAANKDDAAEKKEMEVSEVEPEQKAASPIQQKQKQSQSQEDSSIELPLLKAKNDSKEEVDLKEPSAEAVVKALGVAAATSNAEPKQQPVSEKHSPHNPETKDKKCDVSSTKPSDNGNADPVFPRRPYVFPKLDLNRKPGHDSKHGPKIVLFSCMVNNLLEVNLIDEYFKPDLAILMDWIDDGELKEDWSLKRKTEDMWKPWMQFGNTIEKVEEVEKNTDVYSLRKRPVICSYRSAIMVCFYDEPFPTYFCNSSKYKFDSKGYSDTLSTDASEGWTTKDLKIVAGEMEIDSKIRQLNEYALVDHRIIVREHKYQYFTCYDDSSDPYPEVVIRLTLARNPWYYIMRLVMPQLLLSFMALSTFQVAAEEVADRFSVSGTIVLSEIALYFIAVQMLPRVPYVMRIDIWFTWCFALVFAAWGQNGLVYQFMKDGTLTESELDEFDKWSAIVYIILVVLGTLWFLRPLYKFQRLHAPLQEVHSKATVEKPRKF
eukprot:jgi/Bigna1/73702/fgenesh1_pg.25_\